MVCDNLGKESVSQQKKFLISYPLISFPFFYNTQYVVLLVNIRYHTLCKNSFNFSHLIRDKKLKTSFTDSYLPNHYSLINGISLCFLFELYAVLALSKLLLSSYLTSSQSFLSTCPSLPK